MRKGTRKDKLLLNKVILGPTLLCNQACHDGQHGKEDSAHDQRLQHLAARPKVFCESLSVRVQETAASLRCGGLRLELIQGAFSGG